MRIAVLVTCHNRKALTLRSLRSLVESLEHLGWIQYDLFIVDDGSTDGTGAAIAAAFPRAYIERGNGQLYWNGGMCLAYALARQHGSFSAYLLFNDDVVVTPEAVPTFLSEYALLNSVAPAILVAATRGDGDIVSYSAFRCRNRFRPLRLEKLVPTERPQKCDTFNANFVLVPGEFFERVGGLDRRYIHAYGDIDLGYVASGAGVQPHLSSVFIGFCSPNDSRDYSDHALSRALTGVRGSWGKMDSLAQRVHFHYKHAPLAAQIVCIPLTAVRYGTDKLTRYLERLLNSV